MFGRARPHDEAVNAARCIREAAAEIDDATERVEIRTTALEREVRRMEEGFRK